MIDTIRFKIPVDASTYKLIEAKGTPSMSKKDRLGFSQNSLSDQVYLSELKGGIRLYVLSKNIDWNLYLEFSVPKVFYGHNLFLFYPEQLPEVLFKIMDGLNAKYDVSLPSFETWSIQRLDLCTLWKLPDDDIALAYLQSLRDYEYPRKEVDVRNTTVTYIGSSGTVKFYLKHPEFLAHDYRSIVKVNQKRADKLAEYATGGLRFEAELKKAKLKSVFHLDKGQNLTVDNILDEKLLRNILSAELKTWIKTIDPVVMNDYQIMEKLVTLYDSKKSLDLFSFYFLYTHSQASKTILKKHLDKSTINRKLAQLGQAGVGLRGSISLPFELTIPSPLNPNLSNHDLPDLSVHEVLPDKQLNLPLPLSNFKDL